MRPGTRARPGSAAHLAGRLWWVPVAVWVVFVWSRSLFAGPASDAQSLSVVALLGPAFSSVGVTDVSVMNHVVRKTAHFLEYAVLGVLLSRTIVRPVRAPRACARLALGALVAGVDETIQRFVPLRASSAADVVLDSAGVAFGLALGLVVERLVARARANR